jgi:hypothetical protein
MSPLEADITPMATHQAYNNQREQNKEEAVITFLLQNSSSMARQRTKTISQSQYCY